jgi:hypothetical protein
MAIKYLNIFFSRPSKNFPKCDFWCEKIPSGNTDLDTSRTRVLCRDCVCKCTDQWFLWGR